MTDMDRMLGHVMDAISKENARPFDGDNNFKKMLVISTCVVGPDGRGGTDNAFVFEAKIPRSAVNDLGLSAVWTTNDPAEAADFLRRVATMMDGVR